MPSYTSVHILGSWDNYKTARQTEWNPVRLCFFLRVKAVFATGWEMFQIYLDNQSERCLHPDQPEACPEVDYRICGPDAEGHGLNWVVKEERHLRPGDHLEIRLFLTDLGAVESVDWVKLSREEVREGGASASAGRDAGRGSSVGLKLPAHKTLQIAGEFNQWSPEEMAWDPPTRTYNMRVNVGSKGESSFQVMLDGDWDLRLYPSNGDASPHDSHALCGPDDGKLGHGKNWTIGRHPRDRSAPFARFDVRVCFTEDGRAERVDWTRSSR